MNIGEKIKKTRLLKNMKQADLAEKAYISRVAIGNYERNERTPTVDVLEKIAIALDVDPNYLMDWEEKYNQGGKLADEVKLFEQIESLFGSNAVELLNSFKHLNEAGKNKAVSYVSDLCEIETYCIKEK